MVQQRILYLLVALCFFTLLEKASATINCNRDGRCWGDGEAGTNVCSTGCRSCTYQGHCHCAYTNPDTCCNIEGWRAPDYNYGRCYI